MYKFEQKPFVEVTVPQKKTRQRAKGYLHHLERVGVKAVPDEAFESIHVNPEASSYLHPNLQETLTNPDFIRSITHLTADPVNSREAVMAPKWGMRSLPVARGYIPYGPSEGPTAVATVLYQKGGGISGELVRQAPTLSANTRDPLGLFGAEDAHYELEMSNAMLAFGINVELVLAIVSLNLDMMEQLLTENWRVTGDEFISSQFQKVINNGDLPVIMLRAGSENRLAFLHNQPHINATLCRTARIWGSKLGRELKFLEDQKLEFFQIEYDVALKILEKLAEFQKLSSTETEVLVKIVMSFLVAEAARYHEFWKSHEAYTGFLAYRGRLYQAKDTAASFTQTDLEDMLIVQKNLKEYESVIRANDFPYSLQAKYSSVLYEWLGVFQKSDLLSDSVTSTTKSGRFTRELGKTVRSNFLARQDLPPQRGPVFEAKKYTPSGDVYV